MTTTAFTPLYQRPRPLPNPTSNPDEFVRINGGREVRVGDQFVDKRGLTQTVDTIDNGSWALPFATAVGWFHGDGTFINRGKPRYDVVRWVGDVEVATSGLWSISDA